MRIPINFKIELFELLDKDKIYQNYLFGLAYINGLYNNEVVKSLTREYQGNKVKQTCTRYHYDAFGRRIAKHSDIRQLTKDGDTLKAIQKPHLSAHSHAMGRR